MEMYFSSGGLSDLRDKHVYVIRSRTSQAITPGIYFLKREIVLKGIIIES